MEKSSEKRTAPEEGAQLELRIDKVVYPGRGLARSDGFVVFIDNVITDELVLAKITRCRKSFAEAELIEVIEPSPSRIEPACPLYGECGGCCYQHMTYAEEIKTKQAQLADFFSKAIKTKKRVPLREPVQSPQELGYRNKISLHGATFGGKKFLGYYAKDNKTLLDVEACPLAREELNTHLSELRSDADRFESAAQKDATLTLRHTPQDGAMDWVGRDINQLVTETLPFGDMQVQRSGFFQTNPFVTPLLVEQVTELLKEISPENLLDLYCGCGLFSIAASTAGIPHVAGLEINKKAATAARRNAKALKLTGVDFVCDSVERGLLLAVERLTADPTAVIVDPPRRGLDETVLKAITAARPANVIYISCAADTMVRDAAVLKAAGYRVKFSQIFDMFPRTSCFESLTHLSLQ